MSIIEGIKERFAARQAKAKADELLAKGEYAPAGSVADVYLHPERYSRAARRAVGYYRPTGLLTEQHVGLVVHDDPIALVPRYVRRHLAHMVDARTRRQRKARARIRRLLVARDMLRA